MSRHPVPNTSSRRAYNHGSQVGQVRGQITGMDLAKVRKEEETGYHEKEVLVKDQEAATALVNEVDEEEPEDMESNPV